MTDAGYPSEVTLTYDTSMRPDRVHASRSAAVRTLARRVARWGLTHYVLISACAVALSVETSLLLHRTTHSVRFYGFVFGATLFIYNLHRLSRNGSWLGRSRDAGYRVMAGIGFVGAAACASAIEGMALAMMAAMALVAVLYSAPLLPGGQRLRDVGAMKSIMVAGVWTVVTAWLPAYHADAAAGTVAALWALVIVRRFVFLFTLCLAFDLRDAAHDAADGIQTWPVRLGVTGSTLMMQAGVGLFCILTAAGQWIDPNWPNTVALLIAGIATSAVLLRARRESSEWFYATTVDGMMLLQGMLVIGAWMMAGNK